MLLALTLEYVESLNNHESPTVLTALERVVQAETMKLVDQNVEKAKIQLEQALED